MNKDRRKRIQNFKEKLQDLLVEIEEIREEEQSAYDNLPESFQGGEKGERMYEVIDNLESACSSLEEVSEFHEEAIQ